MLARKALQYSLNLPAIRVIARARPEVVGQYAAMPVRVAIKGREIDAAWGMDVMVAPERQRQGLGEDLFRTWDRSVGASLGLGLSDASHRLFKKLSWPEVGPVPCLVKPLSRRALRRPTWPVGLNRFVSAITLPWIRLISRARPLEGEVRTIRMFDERFTALWDRVKSKFEFAVRRDAPYLNWKYAQTPHVRYVLAALMRDRNAPLALMTSNLRDYDFAASSRWVGPWRVAEGSTKTNSLVARPFRGFALGRVEGKSGPGRILVAGQEKVVHAADPRHGIPHACRHARAENGRQHRAGVRGDDVFALHDMHEVLGRRETVSGSRTHVSAPKTCSIFWRSCAGEKGLVT